jgi:hypothetical protein
MHRMQGVSPQQLCGCFKKKKKKKWNTVGWKAGKKMGDLIHYNRLCEDVNSSRPGQDQQVLCLVSLLVNSFSQPVLYLLIIC